MQSDKITAIFDQLAADAEGGLVGSTPEKAHNAVEGERASPGTQATPPRS